MGLMPLLVPWNSILGNLIKAAVFLIFFLGSETLFLLPAYFLELKGINTVDYLFYGTHGFLLTNAIFILVLKKT